jgi:type II restriction enzyme
MKFIEKYKQLGLSSSDAVFEYLRANLKNTIRTCDFFVAWDKVYLNVAAIEVSLSILNTLIGKTNFNEGLGKLIKKYPEVVPVLPILLALRDNKIDVVDENGDVSYTFAAKQSYSDEEVYKIVNFIDKSGLKKFIEEKKIKNFVDYVTGVEVGLDSNARKNRSGTVMEALAESFVKAICDKHGFKYLTQATADKIEKEFGHKIPTEKADREFDFAIKTKNKVYLLEVNYYAGGGSKLKAVAGEFQSLFHLVTSDSKVGFVWVTDGLGWETALRPLRETFDTTDFVINLKALSDGVLEEILTKEL